MNTMFDDVFPPQEHRESCNHPECCDANGHCETCLYDTDEFFGVYDNLVDCWLDEIPKESH